MDKAEFHIGQMFMQFMIENNMKTTLNPLNSIDLSPVDLFPFSVVTRMLNRFCFNIQDDLLVEIQYVLDDPERSILISAFQECMKRL
jgi:hypothetical protein